MIRCAGVPGFALIAIALALNPCSAGTAMTLLGQPVRPGGTIEVRFPIDKQFQDVAAADGNPRPAEGKALLSFPKGFDPARTCPILVVLSTADAGRTNMEDAPFYERAAMAEGWLLLASGSTITTRLDSTGWRLAHLAAALQALRKQWPQSAHWPVAFAGFSGGAKLASSVGAMLASTNAVKPCGFFLAGINEDRLSAVYKTYRPSADFLNTPIWLSSGMNDPRASYGTHERIRASLVNTGFKRVRLETFSGGHEVDNAQVQLALRWFRQTGNF